MHEVLALALGVFASSSPQDSTFKVAIVTTAGVVIAAAITSYAATFNRKHDPAPAPAPAPAPVDAAGDRLLREELIRRAETAERRCAEAERRNDQLEDLLWSHNINPNTVKPNTGTADHDQP